mgnify:FL=1
MSTHDYNLANQSGASFRSDLNSALAAILSNNSSASSPTTTVAYMFWADTNTNTLKIRNTSNDAWVELLQLDGTLTLEDGSASAVALGFRDELNTGIFSSGANNFDVSIAGTTRLNISATGLNVTGTVTDDGATHDGDVTFTGAAANVVFDKSDNALEFADNAKAVFGTGSDLTISHDGSNSIINDAGTGELQLQRAGNTILTLDGTGISISDPDGTGAVRVLGFEGANATLSLICDEGDDNGDTWQLSSRASDNTLQIFNNTSGSLVNKFTITTAGNVGIGTTDPTQKLVVTGSGTTILLVTNTDDGTAQITLGNTGSGNLNLQQVGGNTLFFEGGSERMRLTSTGHLMIGTTAAEHSETRMSLKGSDHLALLHKHTNTNKSCFQLRNGRASGSTTGTMITFRRGDDGNTVGSVKCTTTATQYNTSSDYRLKENVIAISDGITRLKTLKPYRFNFKDNPNQTVDGFFAHEVTAVPEAVTEEKDSVITQSMIDSGDAPDGEVGDPIYQEMDQSKLVPLLTAALQESILKIETLETKVAALEAA